MAMAALLRSLATKMARAPPTLLARGLHGGARSGPGGSWTHHRLLPRRGLHSLPNAGATPPPTKMDLVTALAKIRAGLAYVALFGTAGYLYGSVLPQLHRIQAKLEARNRAELEAVLALDEAIETVELLLAEQNSAVHAGHGKQHVGETGKGTRHEDLLAEIAKLKLQVRALSKGKV
ncbi:unnamed protein product [Urochloa humidicola]